MQFAVPQFTDVEDKLIGPLTLKQFFILLAAGGLCLMFWSLPISKFISVIIDLPIALGGIALAFAKYNGRPMMAYILPFISFSVSPKSLVFARESNRGDMASRAPMVKVQTQAQQEVPESTDSRLRKLAYLLDQNKQQEGELLNKNK